MTRQPRCNLSATAWPVYGRHTLFHDAGEEEDQLEDEDGDNRGLEKLSARHAGLLDGKTVDVVERLQLLPDVGLPLIQAEPRARHGQDTREVHVAGDLERV